MATAKPVLLTVDDDSEVVRAVEGDLRRHYGERHRVMRASSEAAALSLLLERLKWCYVDRLFLEPAP